MRSDRARLGEGGFSMLEVLVAMVLLTVGLLALEALGIGAARSVRRAASQSRYAATAVRVMEATQHQVRRNPTGAQVHRECGPDPETGFHVCREVHTRASRSGLPRQTAQILVEVGEAEDGPFFTVASYVFQPGLP